MAEKLISQLFKKTAQAVGKEGAAVGKAGKDIFDIGAKSAKNVSKTLAPKGKVTPAGVANTLLTKSDRRGRVATNFYTGRKLNTPVILGAAALGTAALVGSPKEVLGARNLESEKMSDYGSLMGMGGLMATRTGPNPVEASTPAALAADGTAGATSSQAPTLGASGNMVFGMHNNRKGG